MKRLMVLIVTALMFAATAGATSTTIVPVPGLYPSSDGETLQMLIPSGWTLVDTISPPNKDGLNGHVQHGMTYVYRDSGGQTHRVNITYCTGGE